MNQLSMVMTVHFAETRLLESQSHNHTKMLLQTKPMKSCTDKEREVTDE
jgi:hypothetical protein